jgi:hypothetical protein
VAGDREIPGESLVTRGPAANLAGFSTLATSGLPLGAPAWQGRGEVRNAAVRSDALAGKVK